MSVKPLVLTGGEIFNGRKERADVLVKDGKIEGVDKPGAFSNLTDLESLDVTGKLILPGLIDLHVHLREPGFEWKETVSTGAEAAVLGGFTTICAMPNTSPVNDSREVTGFIIEQAKAAKAARVLPIGAISIGLKGQQLAPYSELKRAGCVAFSDDGEPVMNSGLMRRALEWCLMLGIPLTCHEEDKHLSCGGSMNESPLSIKLGLRGMPKVAEEVMVARDIELARTTGAKVHICHVSSARSVELIRRAKQDGIAVTCEVTPHHLFLTEEAIGEYDTLAKMSPPLREEYERLELIRGVADGTIDAVASDHAPHDPDTKLVEFSRASFGILGLQTSLPVLLELVERGALKFERAIESLTSAPANAFGLNAGSLNVGAPADIAVIDLDHRWTFDATSNRSKSSNSPFWGQQFKGVADTVIVGGHLRVLNKRLVNDSRE